MQKMGTLFRYELKKLLSRKLVWLLFAVFLALILYQQSHLLKKDTFETARGMKDIYRIYEGSVVTESFKAKAEKDYTEYIAAHPDLFELSGTDEEGAPYYWSKEKGYYSGVCRAFESFRNYDTVESRLKEVDNARAELEKDASGSGEKLTDASRKYYEKIAIRGLVKPVIHYAQGWKELLHSGSMLPAVSTLFLLGLALLPLFCGESSAKMEGVLLCAAGRRKAAMAKMLAAFGIACVTAVLFIGLSILPTLIAYGFEGAQWTLAEVEWYGRAALPVGSAFGLYMLAVALTACSIAALAALASALFRRPVAALMAIGAFIAVQLLLKADFMYELLDTLAASNFKNILYASLLPVNLMQDRYIAIIDIYEPNYAPYIFGLPMLVGAFCLWLAPWLFLRRRKA